MSDCGVSHGSVWLDMVRVLGEGEPILNCQFSRKIVRVKYAKFSWSYASRPTAVFRIMSYTHLSRLRLNRIPPEYTVFSQSLVDANYILLLR